ncbi:MAG: tRNA (adenosine(37)-N6)-dimethylallyltransferase MiaA [bacterium]|nr:tRNA (adenosine(37)-N6)-dimethylallyltransferase MiaA [bacterium]
MQKLPKIVVVLGPTGSGKTDLGIALAKQFNGEIISADSRQIYKDMRIGTAKPAGVWRDGKYWLEGVPHYMMDIVRPDANYTLTDFKTQADAIIKDILERGKLPIIVGGTGLYIWAVVENLDIPAIAPDAGLRADLEAVPLVELAKKLLQIDPVTAGKIDLKNPRRVLRAIEVCLGSGASFSEQRRRKKPLYQVLQIGLEWPREELDARINLRAELMMDAGLLAEVQRLSVDYATNAQEKSVWDLVSMSGIGYRQMGYHLRGEMDLPAAVELLKRDTRRYAKRQMTWFKRDKSIKWLLKADQVAARKLVEDFL